MSFEVGQGIKSDRIPYPDGSMPIYQRPYLIIEVWPSKIGVLSVSTIQGKEHKLVFPENMQIIKYNPPFDRPSFVLLDSLTYIDAKDYGNVELIANGEKLDPVELGEIEKSYDKYNGF